MFYNATYIILLPAILFTLYAQAQVNRNFNKYSRVRNMRGLTGAQAARRMLDANGLHDVAVEHIRGSLTDHYDPRYRVLRLSHSVHDVASVAAVSVACHEVGHALQHAEDYTPLLMRNNIVPLVNFASRLSWPLILVGILLLGNGSYAMGDTLFMIGVIAFSSVILFHAVTLPVEFNASNRAMAQMDSLGLISYEEQSGAKRVLRAAAMTYVASLAMAILNLVRILAIRGNRN